MVCLKRYIIYVSGKYKDWYIIEINNKFGGFVYSDLLQPLLTSNASLSNNNQNIEKISIENPGNYYALVIGNNKYQYWSQIRSAVRDAKKIAQILKINIILMLHH